MKRYCFLTIVISLIIFLNASKISYAAYFKECDYLEKSQWGALEDILNDWKSKKITTDECVLYGCYVLAAKEPNRKDKNDKIKLLPLKYKFDKKSKSEGPYFFITFLYKNDKYFGIQALEEFKQSDWCDYDIFNMIPDNDEVRTIIQNVQPEDGFRSFKIVIEELEKHKIIGPEYKYLIKAMSLPFNYPGHTRLIQHWPPVFENLKVIFTQYENFYMRSTFSEKNLKNILLLINNKRYKNIINYHQYMDNAPLEERSIKK